MRFDYTKEQPAKYMVSIHYDNGDDFYYFHYFKGAEEFFNDMTKKLQAKGTVINLWDIKKDIRKRFFKVS